MMQLLVHMGCSETSFTYLLGPTKTVGIKLESLDLSENGAELDVVGTVAGDPSEEPPVIEVENGLLKGRIEGGMPI
jgi:hypothetical protein